MNFLMEWRKRIFYPELKPSPISSMMAAHAAVIVCLSHDGKLTFKKRVLIEIAKFLHEQYGHPLIIPLEIATFARNFPNAKILHNGVNINSAFAETKRICDENKWKNVVIVALPKHYRKAVKAARKSGLNPIIISTKRFPMEESPA
ncbi:MAG: hypothetical protein PHP03_02400 [Candidatus Pacebacteria bacterium]|nr:hypothetical protein [Candidatus Paceibacterota bacterium]